MIRILSALSFIATAFTASAAIPPMKITPLGKPDAPVKGVLQRNIQSEPENFSPLSSQEGYARDAYEYVVQGLLRQNPDTYLYEPEIAESYEVSKDFLTYTFKLDKNAKFFDGKPITSEDVKFSVEAVKDPAYNASHRMVYYDDVESVTTPDPHTVVFKMKKKYFKTLQVIGTNGYTPILPKHIYGDPKKKFPDHPIYGSGPYKVEQYNRGKNLMLVRDPNFWAKDKPGQDAFAKFERVNIRFIKDPNLQIEMAKKLQLDFVEPVSAENFEKKAVGDPFGTTIKKMQVENQRPKNYGFVAWNNKDPKFADKETRTALSHLLNRKSLIEKFAFNKSVEGRGPVYYTSQFMPKDVKPVDYNPEKAKKLLAKAGWTDKDKNGILERTVDGKQMEFKFALLLPNRDVEKYFTLYKEDLKKAGIEMNITLIEWNTFSRLLEEQKFEAVTLSWGGGAVEDDLKQIWHSEAARMGGSNFVSYANKDVDKWIDQAREEMDAKKRTVLWQKVVRQIAEDQPYTFFFNPKYDLFLVHSKVGFDKPTYKYYWSTLYWYPLQ